MTRNEGNTDRVIRALIGLALLAAVFLVPVVEPVAYWLMLVVGVVLVVTALTGFCPAYRLLGINTCRNR